eukprot:3536257-Prymnesium_polylepis.1
MRHVETGVVGGCRKICHESVGGAFVRLAAARIACVGDTLYHDPRGCAPAAGVGSFIPKHTRLPHV